MSFFSFLFFFPSSGGMLPAEFEPVELCQWDVVQGELVPGRRSKLFVI
jgi:hypothetical protein